MISPALLCPLDGLCMARDGQKWVCQNGHTYDIARQGYVNLLPVQHKRSIDPGDSKEMVAARREFLDAGFYQPLADRLNALVDEHSLNARECEAIALYDAGCGEGYYFDQLEKYFRISQPETRLSLIGVDISKWAIAAAARRNPAITWVVGSNINPPVAKGSMDGVICMFGFYCWQQFRSLLAANGWLLLVDPGSEHLRELRELIYPEVRSSGPPDLAAAEALGFTLVATEELSFSCVIDSQTQVMNLLRMTPHLYRAPKAGKEAAARCSSLTVTVHVVLRILRLVARD